MLRPVRDSEAMEWPAWPPVDEGKEAALMAEMSVHC
jgi:hypothetical protein